ncbi:S1-like domain-containing RNA-binding protein [Sporolactobacillus sp. CPB3-1]|uniref:S1-like domain-containing RNA-binding protein n=1 Tax=Sporolactobacillus mangiferae TaxID=2940498 RepID=A0ABT0M7B1_9BACL|nr:S1-like domain-containing RNA-binding protein [Sporolactobacillus mangiferae]MCL1630753.1 S1-like domain-containing RNA-binding protein [Sporolactobacillus mangiferae]
MAQLTAGMITTLEVSHKAPFGYFLSCGDQEVLLHEHDTGATLADKDKVTVFLYQDHQGRIAATTALPSISFDTYGWVQAVSLHKKYGVFVDIGIKKDLLLSKDDLPDEWIYWPQPGDHVYCSLKLDKKNRLFACLADESAIQGTGKPAPSELQNKNVQATVYRLLDDGVHVITEEGFLGFIHNNEIDTPLRLGQSVSGRVIAVKEDGRLNLSLKPRSYERIGENAEKILNYMEDRDGAMPYWDKSRAEDIRDRFGISKGDFKKALGQLMKADRLYQKEGWSYLKKSMPDHPET